MLYACNFFDTDAYYTARHGCVGFYRIVEKTAQRAEVGFRDRFQWQ